MITEHYTDNYTDYCKFLQKKYGLPKEDYFTTNSFGEHIINRANIRLKKDGLMTYHTKTNECDNLSIWQVAEEARIRTHNKSVMEWQQPAALCYCNVLEKLLLNMLCVKEQLINKTHRCNGMDAILKDCQSSLNEWFIHGHTPIYLSDSCSKSIQGCEQEYRDIVLTFSKDCLNLIYDEKGQPTDIWMWLKIQKLLQIVIKQFNLSDNYFITNKQGT